MSVREKILAIFINTNKEYSCQQIVGQLESQDSLLNIKQKSNRSASVSSILAKLVKDKMLIYSEKKTERGGHIYKLWD